MLNDFMRNELMITLYQCVTMQAAREATRTVVSELSACLFELHAKMAAASCDAPPSTRYLSHASDKHTCKHIIHQLFQNTMLIMPNAC